MTGKKAMQALLDGKTLRNGGVVITPAEWGLLMKFDDGTCEKIVLEGCKVVEEYPLDFEQALGEMLIGKTVMYENGEDFAYRFRNGRFESSYSGDEFTKWDKCVIFTPMQESKWKVVE